MQLEALRGRGLPWVFRLRAVSRSVVAHELADTDTERGEVRPEVVLEWQSGRLLRSRNPARPSRRKLPSQRRMNSVIFMLFMRAVRRYVLRRTDATRRQT